MQSISIQGAGEHNLKHISLELPRGALVVFTGVSGSGKSSLVYDTIHREGQRRFLETLSSYARQFIGSLERPQVDRIEGLSPTISIDPRTAGRSPRSTVGTITEIHDHLRLLYARLGTPHCPRCRRELGDLSADRICAQALADFPGQRLLICAPVVRGRKGEHRAAIEKLLSSGYARLRIDGEVMRLSPRSGERAAAVPRLKRSDPHTIEVVYDRLQALPESRGRLAEAVEKCLEISGGIVNLVVESTSPPDHLFSARLGCPDCGTGFPEIEPRLFSFNSPRGACPGCNGLGRESAPPGDLAAELPAAPAGSLASETAVCRRCGGARLRPEALAVTFEGLSIADICRLPAQGALETFSKVQLAGNAMAIGWPILKEITARLSYLAEAGLPYLSLDRAADTLAGGEAQRVRLAGLAGSALQGAIFVLDEPSIGLHPRDHRRLLETLRRLRDRGNTVLVVEHDRDAMEAADLLVDLGPGAGSGGGEVVARGAVSDLAASPLSLTGAYLSGRRRVERPGARRRPGESWLEVRGAALHNLKKIDVRIPLGLLVAVTGVSGSGKSSLVHGVIRPALDEAVRRRRIGLRRRQACRALLGAEGLDRVVEIDQAPIGRSPRSNPATYTGVFQAIRQLYAQAPLAQERGYTAGRFSFNRDEGRCAECGGAGVIEAEMEFLPPVEVTCESCGGRRYSRETLEVVYRGRSIAEVLEMPVQAAAEFFQDRPDIRPALDLLERLGLGYLPLGQPATALSGGEAQRVKLATELCRPDSGRTLFILDEPTTGLHFEDVRNLLAAVEALTARGDTALVIEHNLDVIRSADWVIDLGPEGGEEGGRVLAAGPPEEIAACERSHTGRGLAAAIARDQSVPAPAPAAEARPPAGPPAPPRDIAIRGAAEHNLRSIDARIPANRLTVITGVSGSGKSSLAVDTIYAEGRRRYIESLSTYARRFLGKLERPKLEGIDGLAPAIAIDQRSAPSGWQATVGTATEIHDYLRILYARAGRPHCPRCGAELAGWSVSRLADEAIRRGAGNPGRILAPLGAARPGSETPTAAEFRALLEGLVRGGFSRVLAGGAEVRIEDAGAKTAPPGPAFLVIDRLELRESSRSRIAGSFERAFEKGGGWAGLQDGGGEVELFCARPACPRCHYVLEVEVTPRLFSFSSQAGACPRCRGLGIEKRVEAGRLIAHPARPLLDGALPAAVQDWLFHPGSPHREALEREAAGAGIPLERPFSELAREQRDLLLGGIAAPGAGPRGWAGMLPIVQAWYEESRSRLKPWVLQPLLEELTCTLCGGRRLRPEALGFRLDGIGIAEVEAMRVSEALRTFAALRPLARDAAITAPILEEIRARLGFLEDVGLGYLTLDRRAGSLSGGEAQRIRLASQLGNRLSGVLYVLDEPTVGLHARETARLLGILERLRGQGNTLIVVEHDRDVIDRAHWVIDLGPGAGARGGRVVAAGTPAEIAAAPESLTGGYLRGELAVASPGRTLRRPRGELALRRITHNNLRGIDVRLPLGVLTAVSGVSGSGKSSLVLDVLARELRRKLEERRTGKHGEEPAADCSSPRLKSLEGLGEVRRLAVVDQSPIGRSPRSNPATYTGAWDPVRQFLASLPAARVKGFRPDRFSFNRPAGRCQACEGEGAIQVEMHFLPDIWVRCEECGGKRFNRETLSVRFRGLDAGDILELEVEKALEVFQNQPRIRTVLEVLRDVGLGYLMLGQPASTLSGGEAQRVKLAADLAGGRAEGTLYVLDEPTTGLHFEDVRRLLAVLDRLVDGGGTVVVVEHHLDVIAASDWVIDLGPEGGDAGGEIVAAGPPEAIAAEPRSHTGRALAARLARGSGKPADDPPR